MKKQGHEGRSTIPKESLRLGRGFFLILPRPQGVFASFVVIFSGGDRSINRYPSYSGIPVIWTLHTRQRPSWRT